MAGKRHHTIPKFLIRGFASSHRSRVVNVWLYRKRSFGVELNIENVGAEGYFYGKPEEGDLDTRITNLEADFAPLVESLREFASRGRSTVNDERIPALVAHLAFRTRHVRESLAETIKSYTKAALQHMSDKEIAKSLIAKELSREGPFRDILKLALLERGIDNLEPALKQLEPYSLQIACNIMELLGDDYQIALDRTREQYEQMTPAALREGFIESLSRNLSMPERVNAYSVFCWHVVRSATPIILGDSTCLFETDAERRFRPVDTETDQVMRVYLPLSSRAVLVGSRTKSQPQLDVRVLNKAVARCSYEYFVSSCELSKESHLIKGLGMWADLLDEREFSNILKESLPKLIE